jgi:hypothetical protein
MADEHNIIDDLSGEAATETAKLSKELVDRANMAIDCMGLQATNKPEVFAFITASKLKNGDVQYRMAHKVCADWIRCHNVREAFTTGYSGNRQLKNKTYAVISEFTMWLGDFNYHHPLWDNKNQEQLFTNCPLQDTDHLIQVVMHAKLLMALPKGINTTRPHTGHGRSPTMSGSQPTSLTWLCTVTLHQRCAPLTLTIYPYLWS